MDAVAVGGAVSVRLALVRLQDQVRLQVPPNYRMFDVMISLVYNFLSVVGVVHRRGRAGMANTLLLPEGVPPSDHGDGRGDDERDGARA